MASKDDHFKKAQHNERFFSHFERSNTPFLDWVVTGIFYSALHYIRTIASKNNFTNISSYGEIDNLFNRLSIFKRNHQLYYDYRLLKDNSREARYEMRIISGREVEDLINNEFQRIKDFVTQNL